MSITITEKLRKKIQEEQADPLVADLLRTQAVAAILGGLGSPAWETYMRNFADSDLQLQRLMGQGAAAQDGYMKQALAYLVSNAVCGADTVTRTLDKLNDGILDAGL